MVPSVTISKAGFPLLMVLYKIERRGVLFANHWTIGEALEIDLGERGSRRKDVWKRNLRTE